MPDPGWWEALWPGPESVLNRCGMARGLDVMDLCSGDGWFTRIIDMRSRHVFAVDIDPALLSLAETRLRESGIANCSFITGDAYDIAALVRSPVDFVFLANAWHGVPDKPRLSRAIHGALKPGGLLAVVNWYPRPREGTTVLGEPRGPTTELRMSPQATVESTSGSALQFLRSEDVSPYHYAALLERRA